MLDRGSNPQASRTVLDAAGVSPCAFAHGSVESRVPLVASACVHAPALVQVEPVAQLGAAHGVLGECGPADPPRVRVREREVVVRRQAVPSRFVVHSDARLLVHAGRAVVSDPVSVVERVDAGDATGGREPVHRSEGRPVEPPATRSVEENGSRLEEQCRSVFARPANRQRRVELDRDLGAPVVLPARRRNLVVGLRSRRSVRAEREGDCHRSCGGGPGKVDATGEKRTRERDGG